MLSLYRRKPFQLNHQTRKCAIIWVFGARMWVESVNLRQAIAANSPSSCQKR
jgi:hypothetical protein